MNVRRLCPLSSLLLVVCGAISPAAELWDLSAVRKQPLDVEKIGQPRTAPLVVTDSSDWMNTGDAWVAQRKTAGAAAVVKKPAHDEQLIVEELFLSSESTPHGPNRIYCAVARPAKAADPTPVVLIFHGGGGHASGALALAAARRHPGMAGVAMDYNGQFAPGGGKNVTQWKNVSRERKFALVPDLRNWSMYHNVTAARRTIDYLETQPWADAGRIGCVGISYGGWVALLLAGVDDRVKCVTTGVSAGGAQFTAGRAAQQLRWEPAEQRPLWLAHYEPLAHSPHTRAAVFFQLAANDLFFWLNGASRNLEALPGKKGWVVRPNSNHGVGGPELPDTAAPAFMQHVLAGGPPLPEVVDFRASADGLRYSWKAVGPRPITRAVLNWSPGQAVSPGRYWIEFPAQRDGDRWVASPPAEFAKLAAQAYVSIGDEAGIVVSGPLLARSGLDPMVESGPQWPHGQVWDTQRGAAAWRMPSGWLAKTVFEFVSPGGLKVGPDKGGQEFTLVTNSAVLASGAASRHSGLRVRLHGNGQPGKLKLTLVRDTNSLDERAYTAEIVYPAEGSTHDIPWNAFHLATKNVSGPAMPCAFDGLIVSGTREAGALLTLESITFQNGTTERQP